MPALLRPAFFSLKDHGQQSSSPPPSSLHAAIHLLAIGPGSTSSVPTHFAAHFSCESLAECLVMSWYFEACYDSIQRTRPTKKKRQMRRICYTWRSRGLAKPIAQLPLRPIHPQIHGAHLRLPDSFLEYSYLFLSTTDSTPEKRVPRKGFANKIGSGEGNSQSIAAFWNADRCKLPKRQKGRLISLMI
ncbi:hypothetical protein BS50DRAFT_81544 [Corynespora cassiicola Philippines]|uniref:Uncharacterized protein n=1 Tax=Corynespora cassiicola Philippines TaxID=1448308 RepID=A0A2T2NH75_CORCC|nr:hypothetical protein BS50DRAFT_81544 [Corynespora cassiicola Philippines]